VFNEELRRTIASYYEETAPHLLQDTTELVVAGSNYEHI
jgi:hypothetical protein